MHRSHLIPLFASLLVVAACGKKPDNSKAGSGSGSGDKAGSADKVGSGNKAGSDSTAAGSGSAAAGSAAGSGSATAVAAGSGSGSGAGSDAGSGSAGGDSTTITGKRNNNDFGTFDGTKAVYIKNKEQRLISIANTGCKKWACEDAGTDGLGTAKSDPSCSSTMLITLNSTAQPGEPKVGMTKVDVYVGSSSGGGTLTADFAEGVTLSEITADHLTGKIDVKDKDDAAKGSFTAKVCK